MIESADNNFGIRRKLPSYPDIPIIARWSDDFDRSRKNTIALENENFFR
jgi:hypothetical protein